MLSLVFTSLAWTTSWSASLDVLGLFGLSRDIVALFRHIVIVFVSIHVRGVE
jgi:hypothetical protein